MILRSVAAAVLAVHGLIHLIGFLVPWPIAQVEGFAYRTTALGGSVELGTPPDALFAVSYMNDWTLEHIAGYQPHSHGGFGPVPDGPGLGIEVDVSGLGPPLITIVDPA